MESKTESLPVVGHEAVDQAGGLHAHAQQRHNVFVPTGAQHLHTTPNTNTKAQPWKQASTPITTAAAKPSKHAFTPTAAAAAAAAAAVGTKILVGARVRGRDRGGGGKGGREGRGAGRERCGGMWEGLVCCLPCHLNIDRAPLSRRSTAPTAHREDEGEAEL